MPSLIEFLTLEIKVLMISMLPVVELRGAIPYGVAMGMSPIHATILAILGGVVPAPFILLLIRPILEFLYARNLFRNVVKKLFRTKNKARIQKFGFWGVILVVAIPLPGTGVWSGSLAAALLGLRLKRALPAIIIGNAIAGIIVLILSYGASIGLGAFAR